MQTFVWNGMSPGVETPLASEARACRVSPEDILVSFAFAHTCSCLWFVSHFVIAHHRRSFSLLGEYGRAGYTFRDTIFFEDVRRR